MKKRPFLLPLTALAAALTSGHSSAVVDATPIIKDTQNDVNSLSVQQEKSEYLTTISDGNIFAFVLKRGEDGQMMAYHSSHSSHASHASHRSHYSGR